MVTRAGGVYWVGSQQRTNSEIIFFFSYSHLGEVTETKQTNEHIIIKVQALIDCVVTLFSMKSVIRTKSRSARKRE